MNNTRFATVVHILTLLADNEGKWLTSGYIAGSININPVIIRKELAVLQKAGWVDNRKGKEGGSTLLKSCTDISMADIYLLVKNAEVLGKKNLHPNPLCHIGNAINEKLNGLFSDTEVLILNFLQEKSLADFTKEFTAK